MTPEQEQQIKEHWESKKELLETAWKKFMTALEVLSDADKIGYTGNMYEVLIGSVVELETYREHLNPENN